MPAEQLNNTTDLGQLLEGIAAAPAVRIGGIASDSRRVGPGDLFLACAGATRHGLDFLADVVAAGAAAVAYDATTAAPPADPGIPVVAVDNLAGQLGRIANRFFDAPSEALRVTGATGTNGKTTVAWLLRQCLAALDGRCAYLGTLGAGVEEVTGGDAMTTPDTIELHRSLAAFRDAGAAAAAIEVSSHALAQDRVAGVSFDNVLFTNLSRDHLDYHGDMRAYGEAKARLFTAYPARRRFVNLDTEFGTELAGRCGQDVVTVSTRFDRVANGRPHVFVRSVVATGAGSAVRFTSSWGDGGFTLPLPGEFNVANAALVLAVLLARQVPLATATDLLAHVSAPPGRMQRVPGPADAPGVYVDYAHTPAALDVALTALRPHCRGKLWCLFGCGGDRDRGKRPEMGRIAERRADRVVVTSDNPRREAPGAIIAAILAGMQKPAIAIEDRAAAIAHVIATAGPRDCVLVAGKGHETWQEAGGERRPFSDFALAQAALAAREGGSS